MRVLDVIKYSAVAPANKPAGTPDEWPAEVIEKEHTDAVTAGAVRMTEAQFRAHVRQHSPAWRAFVGTKPVFPDVTRKGQDAALLRAFLANDTPTNAQTLAAVKAVIRSLARFLSN